MHVQSLNPFNVMLSQETVLAHWLVAVNRHAEEGSIESQRSLFKLALFLPDYQFLDSESREQIEEIKKIAQSQTWDPTLSPKSSKLLLNICPKSAPQPELVKPSCVKKLNF